MKKEKTILVKPPHTDGKWFTVEPKINKDFGGQTYFALQAHSAPRKDVNGKYIYVIPG